jgi:predicted aspartyl protease
MTLRQRGEGVGFIHVPVSVKAPGISVDRYDAAFLIDTGAIDSMAPGAELRRAGIVPVGSKTYELADGTRHEYMFGIAQIEFMGEITAGRVIFGPDGIEPFLGVTALEAAGVTIDPSTQTLKKLPAVRL